MFRELRRKKQALSQEECIKILETNTAGVLSLNDDYPYGVPISYVYDNNKIYFHSAKSGHKIDCIKNNNKVSFCVIDQDHIVPEEYTTYFKSVIVFGTVNIIEDDNKKKEAIEKLALKYHPHDTLENREKSIQKEWIPLCMLEISIDHISGKQAIELV